MRYLCLRETVRLGLCKISNLGKKHAIFIIVLCDNSDLEYNCTLYCFKQKWNKFEI